MATNQNIKDALTFGTLVLFNGTDAPLKWAGATPSEGSNHPLSAVQRTVGNDERKIAEATAAQPAELDESP